MAKTKANTKIESKNSTLAKLDDGTIQITLTIPWEKYKEEREHVVQEMGQNIEVPGFRKGKAPVDRVIKQIPQDQLTEHTLSHLLPQMVTDAIKEHKITPAIYPKFELVKAEEGQDWQVRAITAEIPEIKLGDYKKHIKEALNRTEIVTPDKAKDEPKEITQDEKEQRALHALIENVDVVLPAIIVDEEVNARLSQLLQRIEKLGLTLESYLSSVGKPVEQLREEYRNQAIQALKLDFILSTIGEEEKVEVSDKEVDEFAKVSNISPEQKAGVRGMLRKRKVIDALSRL